MTNTGRSDDPPHTDDLDLDELRKAPEQRRAQARSLANLTAASAAAGVAGLAFGASTAQVPRDAIWFAIAAVVLLLASTMLYGAASAYFRDETYETPEQAEAGFKSITRSVGRRLNLGSIAAVGAAAAVVVTAVLAAAVDRNTTLVKVDLARDTMAVVQRVCPGLPNSFAAYVDPALIDGGGSLLSLRIEGQGCPQSANGATIRVPRSSVISTVDVDG